MLIISSDVSIMTYLKLKQPEKGPASFSPTFPPPTVGPTEWALTDTTDDSIFRKALEKDGIDATDHPHLSAPRGHSETIVGYGPVDDPASLDVPKDGSIISTGNICFLPTSPGTVRLASRDPSMDAVIEPNYLSTEHDMAALCKSMRRSMQIMNTPAAKEENEWYHPAGTAALGKVVDSEFCVRGVEGLRVLDASVLPLPIAAHIQTTIYAIAEQVADMVVAKY